MNMDLSTTYYNRFLALILHEYENEFKLARPGHCMKIAGLALQELIPLCQSIRDIYPDIQAYILSEEQTGELYISATKLIEFRNALTFPLLVLIPANSKSTTEDSYGNATFKNLSIQHLDEKLLSELKNEIPVHARAYIYELFSYLKLQGRRTIQYIQYLLSVQLSEWDLAEIGNSLSWLTLIPDAGLTTNSDQVRQRLSYNLKCIDILGDFSRSIPDRIASLPIETNTLQKEIAGFLRLNPIVSKSDICRTIAVEYPQLNFTRWEIPDIDKRSDLRVFVDKISSSDLKTDEGDLTLIIPKGKVSKVKIRISTKPIPIDLSDLKYFRIVLMAIDGWYPVTDVKKIKVSENKQAYRDITVMLSENMFEEGSYFFRIIAEDENGGILNTQDSFIPIDQEEHWKIRHAQNPNLTRDEFELEYKIKYTSDSDDFYLKIGTTEDEGDQGIDTGIQRKDKLNNLLQAYFRYRITQLRQNDDLSMPLAIDDSEVWLKDSQSAPVSIFHAKYSSSHNYQISIASKLLKLESCLLSHSHELGHVEAILSKNPIEKGFQSLRFISTTSILEIPPTLLELRKKLFTEIRNSAPNESGVFETFGLFRHIELIKSYLNELTNWSEELKGKIKQSLENSANPIENLPNQLIELQNLDLMIVKTEMPDGQPISVKLISPLHPLRLYWFIDLFDLFQDWEEKTKNNEQYKKAWYRKLENLFLGELIPDIALPVIVNGTGSDYFQYLGELTFGWGIYAKSTVKTDDAFSSISRQIKTYLSLLHNISNEYRMDTDVNETLVRRHIQNYLIQHPYTNKLIINLFNAGDAQVFANTLVQLERHPEYKKLKYEIRLFADDKIITPGEAFQNLINPEYSISEDAEAFSQASGNRLFPKLRFSINSINSFTQTPQDYNAHISFLVSPFPVKTTLIRPNRKKRSFYLNGLINKQIIDITQKSDAIVWNKYFVARPLQHSLDKSSNNGIKLFSNIQLFIANALAAGNSESVPTSSLSLNEPDKVLLSFIHDVSDWVVTFDKNMGPEVYDLPGKNGEVPFLLDYVPGQEISGISSYLTTRPTSEIVGLLGPHFAQFGVDVRTDEEKLTILLEDVRTISSSLILQFNSTENKAFEVLGTAFTKRVLEKKRILENSFLIPVDLHKELFDNLPEENKSRADTLLVKINPETSEITFTVIEIKCRKSLSDSEKESLIEKMESQIDNTINALRFHFDPDYYLSDDRLDRELKTLEFKQLLEFYINRSARYNQLSQEVRTAYLDVLENLDRGYAISFKRCGIIFDFSASQIHKKEIFSEDSIYFTFGKGLIDDILDPKSDLNTHRLEHITEEDNLFSFFGAPEVSAFIQTLEVKPYEEPEQDTSIVVVHEPSIIASEKTERKKDINEDTILSTDNKISSNDAATISIKEENDVPDYDILVGKTSQSEQYGILGKVSSNKRTVALDLSETNTISLFGVQGGGKSYTIGTITEMVLKQFSKINKLPAPLASVIFHYSESKDYEPEFTSMVNPNDNDKELQKLKEEFGANANSLSDIILLTPKDKVVERQQQYPSIEVRPISFNSNELNVKDWMFLFGAIGNDSVYIKQLKFIMKGMRENINLKDFRANVANSPLLSNSQKLLAEQRIQFAEEYIDDSFELGSLIQPGRLIIVDLRNEYIEKDEALGLFVVMLNIISSVGVKEFNKFIVFDEAHKYMDNKDLTGSIVTAIREMRHKGVSIMIASQDPLSLPNEIIELSSIVLLHKFNSPQWVKHVQKSITQLASLTPSDLSSLVPGEGYLWATKSTDKGVMNRPVKIFTRPRVTKHGGETIKAI
ncbi:hypothetical protein FACS1894169_06660 [Bacteroidia bacterium]|nr:hypothetical protein FACS1894169_06660 [Bacteroidia bacterium]